MEAQITPYGLTERLGEYARANRLTQAAREGHETLIVEAVRRDFIEKVNTEPDIYFESAREEDGEDTKLKKTLRLHARRNCNDFYLEIIWNRRTFEDETLGGMKVDNHDFSGSNVRYSERPYKSNNTICRFDFKKEHPGAFPEDRTHTLSQKIIDDVINIRREH